MPRQWTEKQRQSQREVIMANKPWLKSTGPRTSEGKTRSSQNAYLHGYASVHWRGQIRALMRNVKALRRDMKSCGFYNL